MKTHTILLFAKWILVFILFFSFGSKSVAQTNSGIKLPKKMVELNFLDMGVTDVSNNTDASASFSSIFGAKYDKHSVRIMQNFIRYVDVSDTSAKNKASRSLRIFVGFRLYVSFTNVSVSGNLSLSQLALATTIGQAKASYRLITFGFPHVDYAKLPPTSSFDTSTYNHVRVYFDSLVTTLNDTTDILPIITTTKNFAKLSLDGNFDMASLATSPTDSSVQGDKLRKTIQSIE